MTFFFFLFMEQLFVANCHLHRMTFNAAPGGCLWRGPRLEETGVPQTPQLVRRELGLQPGFDET